MSLARYSCALHQPCDLRICESLKLKSALSRGSHVLRRQGQQGLQCPPQFFAGLRSKKLGASKKKQKRSKLFLGKNTFNLRLTVWDFPAKKFPSKVPQSLQIFTETFDLFFSFCRTQSPQEPEFPSESRWQHQPWTGMLTLLMAIIPIKRFL